MCAFTHETKPQNTDYESGERSSVVPDVAMDVADAESDLRQTRDQRHDILPRPSNSMSTDPLEESCFEEDGLAMFDLDDV